MALKFKKLSTGGGATISTKGGWTGTAVPNSGTLSEIYFNTALSVEEVVAKLSKLTYTEDDPNGYLILSASDMSMILIVVRGKTSDGNDSFGIGSLLDDTIYFSYNANNFVGWNPTIFADTNKVVFNNEITLVSEFNGMPAGTQNDLISSLISTTPFEQVSGEQIVLEGDYDGSTLVIDEVPKSGWTGTAVPNTGFVEKVYINTALSNEEVMALIESIEHTSNFGDLLMWNILTNADNMNENLGIPGLGVVKQVSGIYQIMIALSFSEVVIAWSSDTGWQEGVQDVYTFNVNASETYNNLQVSGIRNEEFKSLFSITPFSQGSGLFDMRPYIVDEKKIPLDLDIKLQEKSVTENGEVVADEGYYGLSKVNVNVAGSGGGIIEVDTLPETGIEGTIYKTKVFAGNQLYVNFPNVIAETDAIFKWACSTEDFITIYFKMVEGISVTCSSEIIELNESNINDLILDNPTGIKEIFFDEANVHIDFPIYYATDEYTKKLYGGFSFISYENGNATPYVHNFMKQLGLTTAETDTEIFHSEISDINDINANGYYLLPEMTEGLFIYEDNTYKTIAKGTEENIVKLMYKISDLYYTWSELLALFGQTVDIDCQIISSKDEITTNPVSSVKNSYYYVYIYDADADGIHLYCWDGLAIVSLDSFAGLAAGGDNYLGIITNLTEAEAFANEKTFVLTKTKTVYYVNNESITPDGNVNFEGAGIYNVTEYETATFKSKNQSTVTVTPTKSTQIITPDDGYDGLKKVQVNAIPSNYIEPSGNINIYSTEQKDVTNYSTAQVVDSNLVAKNIAEGVTILGITGTHVGGTDTTDANAIATDIKEGKTAYVNGTKITGTMKVFSNDIVYGYDVFSYNIEDSNGYLDIDLTKLVYTNYLFSDWKNKYFDKRVGIRFTLPNSLTVTAPTTGSLKYSGLYYGVTVNAVESSDYSYDLSLQKRIDTCGVQYLFYEYTGTSLDFISELDFSNISNMSHMFSNCYSLTEIPLLDTSNVTNMQYMFYNCTKLTTVPLFDTSKVTNMYGMFNYCTALTTIPQFDTSKVTSMANMFYKCTSLTEIPQLDMSNVTNVNNMFSNCTSLTEIPLLDVSKVNSLSYLFYCCYNLSKIDLTYYNISDTGRSNYIFQNCYSLKQIVIRDFGSNYTINSNSFTGCYHLTGTVNATYNPNGDKDCYIYVPSAMVDTLKSATTWSLYADQIRALEDYTVDGTTTGELDETKI